LQINIFLEVVKLKEIAKNSLGHLEKEILDSKKYSRKDSKLIEELRKVYKILI
jgi:hypothetical protein